MPMMLEVEVNFGLAAADFNQDGKLDFAVGYNAGAQFVVLLGNGDGSFQMGIVTAGLAGIYGMATGDVNKDGLPDLAIGSSPSV